MNVQKLEDLCTIVRGSSPRPKGDPRYYGGNIPRLMVSDVTRDGMYVTPKIDFLTIEGQKLSRPMKKGDLVVAVSGDPGEPSILNIDACIHDGFVGIRGLDSSLVFTPYLYRYFKYFKLQNKSQAVGAIYKNLNTDQIKALQIPLPPLEEQKRIAAILDAADLHRQKTKELIAKYDNLAQALFLDMFGDPVINPKGWEKVELEKVCLRIFGGGTPSKSKPEYYEGYIPWVTPKDMKSNFISDSIDHINQNAINNSSTKLIPKNSLLMVIRSGILKHTLPVGINLVDVSINQDMKAFIPNLNLTSPEFLLYFFKTTQSFLLSKVRAVTADNIEFSQIKNFGFPLVKKELIADFSERVKICTNQKSQAEQSYQKAEELFHSLLQKAFKGEL